MPTWTVLPDDLETYLRYVNPGDTLELNGTYTEKIIITRSGTPEKPITLRVASGQSATLTYGIQISGSWWTIEGLTFNSNYNHLNDPLLKIFESSHCTLRNCSFTKSVVSAIEAVGSDNWKITSCTISNTGLGISGHGIHWKSGGSLIIEKTSISLTQGHGLYLKDNVFDALIYGCDFISNAKSGIVIGGSSEYRCKNILVKNCYMNANTNYGITVDWDYLPGPGLIVEYNYAQNNSHGDFPTGSAGLGLTYSNNTVGPRP